jgi:hypothetical protein
VLRFLPGRLAKTDLTRQLGIRSASSSKAAKEKGLFLWPDLYVSARNRIVLIYGSFSILSPRRLGGGAEKSAPGWYWLNERSYGK